MRTPVTTPEPMAHARLRTPPSNSWRDIALNNVDHGPCDGIALEHLIDLQRTHQIGEER
ncbi:MULTISPECIES: hypothetical protein [Sulfitobacter]|uniref:Uncharacterized protein n=1 Tax=Sulfitobacter dubius TaxID=218673 RepID=A0ABY3ZLL9_9RHOB|nr:hypothetical protein [Sulfitobacter dubius]UOA15535.1 hypothetical protein DSM109990_02377 [Sulfitobacter dubius]WOI29038.1 hypothetical protein R1T39_15335 [Sulfitobacter dubius]SFH22373.1 hypothetical protein SAMN04488039_103607 [Sulfitobacter dubius]